VNDANRQAFIDRLAAGALGLAVAAFAWLTGNSLEFPPDLWNDVAIAAGLRPPAREFPLLWHLMAAQGVKIFGLARFVDVLRYLGPVSLGVLAYAANRFFASFLPDIMTSGVRAAPWRSTIVRLLLALGTLFFVCSQPVWRVGRIFSPEMFCLVFTVGVLLLTASAFKKVKASRLVLSGALTGVLAGETPFAFLIPVFNLFLMRLKVWDNEVEELPDHVNPILAMAVRRMIYLFVVFWAGSMALNLQFYRSAGGVESSRMVVALLEYLIGYTRTVSDAFSPMGWVVVVIVIVLPSMIVLFRFKALSNAQKLPPVVSLLFLLVVGFIAFVQSTGFSCFHFWNWLDHSVKSVYAHCLCLLISSLTTMAVLAVFAVDVYFRNYGRLLRELFPEAVEQDPKSQGALRSMRFVDRFIRPVLMVVPLVALLFVLPYKFDRTVGEMSDIINDAAKLTVAECKAVRYVFTDGSIDAAVEVLAKIAGADLKTLSMMSGKDKYHRALRLRGESEPSRRSLLSTGAAETLRTWVREGHPAASNLAVQVGLELWKHDERPLPPAGGLVCRTDGFAPGQAEAFAEKALALAERIVEFYRSSSPKDAGCKVLSQMFYGVQWRLSRMCRIRAMLPGCPDAQRQIDIANRLDNLNPEWRKVMEKMDVLGKYNAERLTAREGLKLGLDRADFRLAREYAKFVLATNPDDVLANFALGMAALFEKRYDSAEVHFKRCLMRDGDEPAILNNLAIVYFKMGRYAEAETNALKAVELLPRSARVKKTLEDIREARKKSEKGGAR
jgi:tetratricopeptide (TPR) repeat protein